MTPREGKFFPIEIYAALTRVLINSPLSAKLRATAAALAACADRKDPGKGIFVQQKMLAGWIGRNPRTICRHMAELVELGWLFKEEQGRVGRRSPRFVSGKYAGCNYYLTPLAIEQLGLAPKEPKVLTPKEHVDRGFDQKTKLPHDLVKLHTEKGLSIGGIFALMKIANKHDKTAVPTGKRLSDLVEVNWEYWKNIKDPSGLFGAIKRLAELDTDYAFVAATQRQKKREQLEKGPIMANLDDFKKQFRNTRFRHQDGRELVFDSHCNYLSVFKAGRLVMETSVNNELANALLQELEVGKVTICPSAIQDQSTSFKESSCRACG